MLNLLTASTGGLMRIKGTASQPMALGGFLSLVVDIFFLFVPLVWARSMGWLVWTISTKLVITVLAVSDECDYDNDRMVVMVSDDGGGNGDRMLLMIESQ